jgi:adenylate cyclase
MEQPGPTEQVDPLANAAFWRSLLEKPGSPLHRHRRLNRLLPSSPRCKVCAAPFRGPGGVLMRLRGIGQSNFNPQICSICEHFARRYPGGAELELTLLFGDIRGSTALAQRLGTVEFTRLVNRFYLAATGVLTRHDAVIDRLLGDEVVAVFIPAFVEGHVAAAVRAAEGLLRATGHGDPGGPWVPVGVGVHTGPVFFGAVGHEGKTDITVLGDNANIAARLASLAGPGEVLVSEVTARAAGLDEPGQETRQLELKGRSEPIEVRVLRVGQTVAQQG